MRVYVINYFVAKSKSRGQNNQITLRAKQLPTSVLFYHIPKHLSCYFA